MVIATFKESLAFLLPDKGTKYSRQHTTLTTNGSVSFGSIDCNSFIV